MKITLYLVGEDKDDAWSNLPFSDFEAAEDYALDHKPKLTVYSVLADIDFSTMSEA